MALLLGGATVVMADHDASPFIDLASAPGLEVTHNDAIFRQGGTGAGTGNWNPFLTYNVPGSQGSEEGYNSDNSLAGVPQFDEFYGGSRTHTLRVSAIPVITVGGINYREFGLDSNDSGADDFQSIDTFKVFEADTGLVSGFDGNQTFSSGATDLIYDMDAGGIDTTVLLRSQAFNAGSGVSDITVLVPESVFDPDCEYGAPVSQCDRWVILYTDIGNYVEDGSDPVSGAQNWNSNAGFEEWQTNLQPVVNVQKTADVSLTVAYDWTLVKEVSIDGGANWVDAAEVDLFVGESQDYLWRLVATRSAGVASDQMISGTITITNPTGGAVIDDDIPATITSIVDNIDFDDATPDLNNIALVCPDAVPFVLGAGDSVECTYSVAALGASATTTGTNEVTVTVTDAGTDTVATDTFDFAVATVTEVDATATLSDPEVVGADQVIGANQTFVSSTLKYECGSSTLIENTGTLTENDSQQVRMDTASLDVDCFGLTVEKTANTFLTQTYDWTIEKQVAKGADQVAGFGELVTLDLFDGQSGVVTWKLTATRSGPVDSGAAVTGLITINNPAPITAVDVSVADSVPGGTAVINCGDGPGDTLVTVPANSPAQCSYSASTDGSNGTNTATATLFGEGYQGTAAVDFTNATISEEIDETAKWQDLPEVALAAVLDGGMTTYNETFTCGVDDGRTNTARITNDDTGNFDEDSAAVGVNCYELTVEKTATTSFDRDWDWTIEKTSDVLLADQPLQLMLGQSFIVEYWVELDATFEDFNHSVAGTITINNPAPIAAVDVLVADSVPGALGPAVINCGGGAGDILVTVAANSSAQCSYAVDLPNATTRTNTATATHFGVDYTGEASVVFDATPDNETDESVEVSDTLEGTLGTVLESDTDKSFHYTMPIDTSVCGPDQRKTNIASFVTNDNAETGEDTLTITYDVLCPTGCTLTIGYWKTHNATFPGGTPVDDNWANVGSLAELEEFLGSGDTWYDVFWTPPRGGNAWYILAHQYMGAVLNVLNGADDSVVAQTLVDAEALLIKYENPQSIQKRNPDRSLAISLAGTLGAYNEGLIGPGHCDEDGNSAP